MNVKLKISFNLDSIKKKLFQNQNLTIFSKVKVKCNYDNKKIKFSFRLVDKKNMQKHLHDSVTHF